MLESYEFGDLKNSFIQIVLETHDEEGRECLLRERPVPDLDRAIQSHKAAEITSAHNQVMVETTKVEAVFYTDKRNRQKKMDIPKYRTIQNYRGNTKQKPLNQQHQKSQNGMVGQQTILKETVQLETSNATCAKKLDTKSMWLKGVKLKKTSSEVKQRHKTNPFN